MELSQHPVDHLIRALINTRRQATPEEVRKILIRMASVQFDPRVISVPDSFRGIKHLGRILGVREPALFLHLVIRIVVDGQWASETTEQEFLEDLRQAILHPEAHLALYQRRGGSVAAVGVENRVPLHHRGTASLPWMYVVYSADRGIIVSGYQITDLREVAIPENVQWLR